MAFQFKIQLNNITDPPVWRMLLVPAQFTFLRFHKLIQAAFRWENYHLFQFSPKGFDSELIIEMPYEEDDMQFDTVRKKLQADKVILSEIFTVPKQKFIYLYDFGDDWVHQIILEKITDEKLMRADCLAGMGACPPEDCGGPWGYENLKAILANPKDPEHSSMKEWLGMSKKEKWDAEAFDLEEIRKLIAGV